MPQETCSSSIQRSYRIAFINNRGGGEGLRDTRGGPVFSVLKNLEGVAHVESRGLKVSMGVP